MDYVLQAALWDRLMDLPSGFFRKFGAGDLAERASGINAIRGLIFAARAWRDPGVRSARWPTWP